MQLEDSNVDKSPWCEAHPCVVGSGLLTNYHRSYILLYIVSCATIIAIFCITSVSSPASLQMMLQKHEQFGLTGKPLQSCTASSDQGPTGFTRAGSCKFEPDDLGYHEVCVTMTHEFLKESAKQDGNDLSSVVAPGGHWCICAWAWASAVTRDPNNAEGLKLDCTATNGHIRQVYQAAESLAGPTGTSYETKAALDKVNALCSHGAHLRQNMTKS